MKDFPEELFLAELDNLKMSKPSCMHISKPSLNLNIECCANWFHPFTRIESTFSYRNGEFSLVKTELFSA